MENFQVQIKLVNSWLDTNKLSIRDNSIYETSKKCRINFFCLKIKFENRLYDFFCIRFWSLDFLKNKNDKIYVCKLKFAYIK